MKSIEYKTVDKSAWSDGPWKQEPDKAQWQDEATGMPCLIVRGPAGALCGYVGVGRDHPLYEKSYTEDAVGGLSVHGGVNFARKCAPAPTLERWEKLKENLELAKSDAAKFPRGDAAQFIETRGHLTESFEVYAQWSEAAAICHLVEPGEDDDVWWLGFDCSHLGDYAPKAHSDLRMIMQGPTTYDRWDNVYRDIAYVKEQVAGLARQLVRVSV